MSRHDQGAKVVRFLTPGTHWFSVGSILRLDNIFILFSFSYQ